VVEVERVRADAVEQRRARRVDTLAAAEDRSLRRGLEILERRERRLDRCMARRADGAADPVEQRTLRLALYASIPSAGRVTGDELGENWGDWRTGIAAHNASRDRALVHCVSVHSVISMPRLCASRDHLAMQKRAPAAHLMNSTTCPATARSGFMPANLRLLLRAPALRALPEIIDYRRNTRRIGGGRLPVL